MNTHGANILNALFEFHPRDGHTPEENFLTEAFVYVLRTSKSAQNAWLSLIMGIDVSVNQVDFQTRSSEREEEGNVVYPDLLVDAKLLDGRRIVIVSEHKWGSKCEPKQLDRYVKLAQRRNPPARVIFIGSKHDQIQEARKILDVEMPTSGRNCFSWGEVFHALSAVPELEKNDIMKQFLDFMETYGLDPGVPMTNARLKALYDSSGILESLERSLVNLYRRDWKDLPERYRKMRMFHRANGTLTLLFATERWRPAVTVGFLHDPTAYGVAITDNEKGIDLMLRIAAGKAEELRDDRMRLAWPVVREKREQLRGKTNSALLVGEKGNGDQHALLIVQSCLADVIEKAKTESDQHDLIFERLEEWVRIIFADGTLDEALQNAGLNGVKPGL